MKVLSFSGAALLAVSAIHAAEFSVTVYENADYKGASFTPYGLGDGLCRDWPPLLNKMTSLYGTGPKNKRCILYTDRYCPNGAAAAQVDTGNSGYFLIPNVGPEFNDKLNAIKCLTN